MKVNYIKTNKNKYVLQVENDPSVDSRWSFYITDGVSAWDGGFNCGLGSEWEVIDLSDIPTRYTRIRQRLERTKSLIESNNHYVRLNRYSFDLR